MFSCNIHRKGLQIHQQTVDCWYNVMCPKHFKIQFVLWLSPGHNAEHNWFNTPHPAKPVLDMKDNNKPSLHGSLKTSR